MCVCVGARAGCLVVSDFAALWAAAHQAVLSVGFLLQGIEPMSPASLILFHFFFHDGLSQDIEYGFLC